METRPTGSGLVMRRLLTDQGGNGEIRWFVAYLEENGLHNSGSIEFNKTVLGLIKVVGADMRPNMKVPNQLFVPKGNDDNIVPFSYFS